MNNYNVIAAAIFLGFALVAGAILFKTSPSNSSLTNVVSTNQVADKPVEINVEQIRRAENPHLYGNPEAAITIVEFSDFECPYCARLHPTLKQVVDESNGEIAWEYRHLPLPNHRNAFAGAVASECVTEQLGSDGFWLFTEVLFGNIGSHSQEFFANEAQKLGVNLSEFEACVKNPDIAKIVQDDLEIAQSSGGNGTPFNVIIYDGDKAMSVAGAQPYQEWMRIIGNIK